MSAGGFLLALVVVTAGSLIQGSIGLGLGMVGAPLLMLIDARLVPGPLLIASLGLVLLILRRDRHDVDLSGLGWAVGGRVVGTAAGAAAFAVLSARELSLLFGGLVLLSVAMSLSGVRLRPMAWTLVPAGLLSGLMGTTTSIGGPPIALVYQHATGARLRATLSSFFAIGILLSLAALALVGRMGRLELALGLGLLPGVFAGYRASRRSVAILDRGYTRAAVLAVSSGAAVAIIIQSLG